MRTFISVLIQALGFGVLAVILELGCRCVSRVRRRLWEEMLHVMEIAGLPINDKQRGYFLPKA